MNKQNNIDQLFANKLSNAGIKPSDDAWSQLQANLADDKKNRGAIWMKIAAAVVVLLVATLSVKKFWSRDQSGLQFASVSEEMQQAPFPIYNQEHTPSVEGIISLADEHRLAAEKKEKNFPVMQPAATGSHLPHSNKRNMTRTLAVQENIDQKEQKRTNASVSIEEDIRTTEAVAFENSVIQESDPIRAKTLSSDAAGVIALAENPVELPKVTITYKAQQETTGSNKSKFSLKKVISSAKKLANGELIADLREAKDDLIHTAFKQTDD